MDKNRLHRTISDVIKPLRSLKAAFAFLPALLMALLPVDLIFLIVHLCGPAKQRRRRRRRRRKLSV